jgi:hypothetical protein
VLALLREARSSLLDRAVWFGDILALTTDSDAARWHLLRSGRHGENDWGRIEGEELSFIAVRFYSALRCCLVLRD